MALLPPIQIIPLHSFGKSTQAANSAIMGPGSVKYPNFYMTDFQEQFDPRYSVVNTFGRMDPIMNYQGTGRRISLGLKVTRASVSKTFHTKMKKVVYPTYESATSIPNALLIQRPPLVMVSFGNLIRSSTGTDANPGFLLCALEQYAATPSAGFTPLDSPLVRFGGRRSGEKGDITSRVISFQTYQFKFDFIPLHSQTPGFNGDSDPVWIGGDSF